MPELARLRDLGLDTLPAAVDIQAAAAQTVTTGMNDEMQPALSADGAGLYDLYYMRNPDNTLDVVVANST